MSRYMYILFIHLRVTRIKYLGNFNGYYLQQVTNIQVLKCYIGISINIGVELNIINSTLYLRLPKFVSL